MSTGTTTIHSLKIEQQYLDALKSGEKTFEIRLNDRGYQKGDILEFWDYSNGTQRLRFRVTYVHSGLGLQPNYVVMSVIEEGENIE